MVFLNCSLRLLNADKNLQLKQCQENTCKVEVIDHSRIVENPETHQLKFYRKKLINDLLLVLLNCCFDLLLEVLVLITSRNNTDNPL